MPLLSDVSDERLLLELHRLAGSQRRVMAELVLHLGEVDARRLYADEGFPSLFSYCVGALRFSEDEACRRIEAARLARRFPSILPLLEAGAVTLTVLGLLKPHLTPDTQADLLAGISGKSVRRAEEWLASRFPRPDVRESIRKLPGQRTLPRGARDASSTPDASPAPPRPALSSPAPPQPALSSPAPPQPALSSPAPPQPALSSPAPPRPALSSPAPPQPALSSPAPPRVPLALAARPDDGPGDRGPAEAPSVVLSALAAPSVPVLGAERARVRPLSHDRFLVKLTASRALKEKLELARDLLSHGNPSGNLAVVVERALDVLLAKLEQKKLGHTERSERKPVQRVAAHEPAQKEAAATARVRSHVTSGARRIVVAQDGLRCSFVAPGGHRCEARAFLEFDHVHPKGLGGGSEPPNIRILCRAHNRLAGERIFGKAHVARKIAASHAEDERTGTANVSPQAARFRAEAGPVPGPGHGGEGGLGARAAVETATDGGSSGSRRSSG